MGKRHEAFPDPALEAVSNAFKELYLNIIAADAFSASRQD
jgi:hypothetical protein